MANPGLDDDGTRRHWFWNLALPRGIHHSWLFLDSRLSLAGTAICSVVRRSGQGSVGHYASLDFKMAAPALVNRMPAWCRSLRSWSLLVAAVAGAVASRSCFCSFRLACVGSRND